MNQKITYIILLLLFFNVLSVLGENITSTIDNSSIREVYPGGGDKIILINDTIYYAIGQVVQSNTSNLIHDEIRYGFYNALEYNIQSIPLIFLEIRGGGEKVNDIIYYDVIIETLKNEYNVLTTAGLFNIIKVNRDEVTARIIIKNTGDIADKDTILYYYLLSPSGKKFGESKEVFYQVPVGRTTLTKTIRLPLNTEFGEWKFFALYQSVDSPDITVYDSFIVSSETKYNYWTIIIIIIIILSLLILLYILKRNKDNE